jgi:predicted transcriptional regulator
MMVARRAMGALETEVLECLWAADEPLTPRAVLEETGEDLAYTTIMTILTRLWQKGLVERERSGKAYFYSPLVSEPDLLASRMRSVLETSADQKATLSRFVETLSKREANALRSALGQLGPGKKR